MCFQQKRHEKWPSEAKKFHSLLGKSRRFQWAVAQVSHTTKAFDQTLFEKCSKVFTHHQFWRNQDRKTWSGLAHRQGTCMRRLGSSADLCDAERRKRRSQKLSTKSVSSSRMALRGAVAMTTFRFVQSPPYLMLLREKNA
ncbi:hypothetical protein MRX96_013140 [Rhipicephalus microplus]